MDVLDPVRSLLREPHPALPRPLDALSECWARRAPRARTLVVLTGLLALLAGTEARVAAIRAAWGGPPVRALVATADLAVGARPAVEEVTLPPRAVPPSAVTEAPEDARLALALPKGAVLTSAHLAAAGPAAGLDPTLRVVPVPVEVGWGVEQGGWVDVWVLGAAEDGSSKVAEQRPVVEITEDEMGAGTALIGLGADEVARTMQGLAVGQVVLTQAPPPDG